MHVVGPEVHEAGLVLVAHQEVERLVDEVARAVPAFHVVLVAPDPVRGGQFGSRVGAFPRRTVLVEAERGDRRRVLHIAPAAHVPLAEVSGGVPGVAEDAGHRGRFGGEVVGLFAGGVAFAGLEVGVDAPLHREHARGEPHARGRADRSGGIVAVQDQTLRSQAVDGGRFDPARVGAREVADAHVVGVDDHDVRAALRCLRLCFCRGLRRGRGDCSGAQQSGEDGAVIHVLKFCEFACGSRRPGAVPHRGAAVRIPVLFRSQDNHYIGAGD